MFLFVGLGNFGNEYAFSRHNIGFIIIDEIVKSFSLQKIGKKNDSLIFKGKIGSNSVIAIKPMTMMNNSGLAVQKVKSFYKIPLSKVFIFYDDLDLAFSKIKIKIAGSSAGHRGIESVDNSIGKNYYRVRFGIGKPVNRNMVSKFVLSNFSKNEFKEIYSKTSLIANFIELLFIYEFSTFLNNITVKKVGN